MSEDLVRRIRELAAERRAVILSHNYQRPEVQDVADFTGDSLELSVRAAASDAKVIVFCGVRFMAETAAILSPGKTVIVPDPEASCPLADMADAQEVRRAREENPGASVVCYVNSTAEVKAESDICCTSANAQKVVESLPADNGVLFIPDRHLGEFVRERTGRRFLLWRGYCPTHVSILPEHIEARKHGHPGARVIVHPECIAAVRAIADAVLSTGGMCRYVRETEAEAFIVGTETGMLHRLRRENPGKVFLAAWEGAVCPNMKLTTLEKLLWSLEEMRTVIVVEEGVRKRAEGAVRRMIALAA